MPDFEIKLGDALTIVAWKLRMAPPKLSNLEHLNTTDAAVLPQTVRLAFC